MADKSGPSTDWIGKFGQAFGAAWNLYQKGPIDAVARWAYAKYGDKVFDKGSEWLKHMDKTFATWRAGTYAKWKVPYYNKKPSLLPMSGWQDTPGTDPAEWRAIYDKQQYGGDTGVLASAWKWLFGGGLPDKYKIFDYSKFTPNNWNFFVYNTFTLPTFKKAIDAVARGNYLYAYTSFSDRMKEVFGEAASDTGKASQLFIKAMFNYLWKSVRASPGAVAWWYKNIMPYQMLVPWWMLKYVVSKGYMTSKAALRYGPPMVFKPVSALYRANQYGQNATARLQKFLADNMRSWLDSAAVGLNRLNKENAVKLVSYLADKYSGYFASNDNNGNLLGNKRKRGAGGAYGNWSPPKNYSLLYKKLAGHRSSLSAQNDRDRNRSQRVVYKDDNRNNTNNMETGSQMTMNTSMFNELYDYAHEDEPGTDAEMERPVATGGVGGAPNGPDSTLVLKSKNGTKVAQKVAHNWFVPGVGPVTEEAFKFYQKLLFDGYDKDAAADIIRDDIVEDWQVAEDYAVEDADRKKWKYASYSNENWNSSMIAAPKMRRGRFNLNNYKRSFASFRRKKSYFAYDVTPFKLSCSFRAWHLGNYNAPYIANQSVKTDCQWFKLLVDAENTVGNLTTSSNYSECITGADILNRIMQDNTVTAPIWKMFNLFCLKGVSVKISCSRRAVANSNNVYPSSANYVLALYWGKDNANQLPVPAQGQTKYDYLFDKDNAMRFTTTNVDLRPYSKYFRARYDSMGWGGSTWNSIEKLNTAPFLVCLENQQEYYAELSPIFDVTFDVYILLKSKNA